MKYLSNSVYQYYLNHFNEMPLEKQFHFASRLYVWHGDEKCHELLSALKPRIMPNDNIQADLAAIHSGQIVPLLPGNHNVLHLRKPLNDRYPQLRSTARLLYWAAMLEQAYGAEARSAASSITSEATMQQLYDELLADDAAVAILSTHAVNFVYLYKRYYLGQTSPNPQHFGRIAADANLYDFSDPLHTQLRIYLLTHTIIADSMFYAEPLPPTHKDAHKQLVMQLESLLSTDKSTSLDTKLEFLVCCKLVGHTSKLEAKIESEASRSVSPLGTFLVDTENSNSNSSYTSFAKSEHRNVLFVLSQMPRRA